MAPRRRRLPSFCKILLDRPAPQLPLPPDFVRKHLENNIPEDPTLLSVNGGYSWRLKIRKDGDNYCFADGWRDVVEDSLLEYGDFLVFWLVDESTFKLSVFSPSGCEKMFPLNEDEEDDHVEEEDEVAQMNEQVKQEEELDDEDEEEEDDDEEEQEQEQESEDEDEDFDEEEEEEEEEDDVYEGGGGGGGEEEDEGDEEDDDGDGDIDGNDGDPFFMRIISEDHTRSLRLRLPLGFARLAGLDRERRIKMKNIDGEEWSMSLLSERCHYTRYYYTRYYLSAGWVDFMRVNHLNEGDKCVFKYIRSEDKLCLAKVTKKRVSSKPPAVKVPATENVAEPVKKRGRRKRPASEVPAEEVLKRTRKQPPRVQVGTEDDRREVVKKGRGRRAATRAPVAEVMRRTRGKRRRVEVESKDDRREVVKRKTCSKQETRKAPVTEVLQRLRGRPRRVEEKVQSKKPAEKSPVAEVLKRKRGCPRVEVESKNDDAKVVKRGRPSRLLRTLQSQMRSNNKGH